MAGFARILNSTSPQIPTPQHVTRFRTQLTFKLTPFTTCSNSLHRSNLPIVAQNGPPKTAPKLPFFTPILDGRDPKISPATGPPSKDLAPTRYPVPTSAHSHRRKPTPPIRASKKSTPAQQFTFRPPRNSFHTNHLPILSRNCRSPPSGLPTHHPLVTRPKHRRQNNLQYIPN